ncbi:MAG: YidC/Oxa1 family membrane protein insertase [Actinomycetota bacterium]
MGIPFFEVFATALAAIYSVVRDYGAAIILLTLAVRLILLPLSIKQTKSMREMQRIGPEVKRLQQKHKGDRQKAQAEVMALYKEHGVNPLGGCAPLVLQFPVLIALYWVIRQPLNYMDHLSSWALPRDLMQHALGVHRFLGLRLDCSAATVRAGEASEAVPDVACGGGAGFAALLPYVLLIAIMGFTTFYQQKQMQAAQGPSNPQAQQMQMMMRVMPLFLMVIGYSFPAALILYWTVTNLWTITQQRIMLQSFPPVIGDADPKPSSGKPPPSGKGSRALQTGAKPSVGKAPSKGRRSGDGHKAPAASSPSSKKRRKR